MPWEMTSTVAPPRKRKKTKSTTVAPAPRLARNWIPRSTPDVAESTNSAVTMTMMTTATPLAFSRPVR